MRRASSSSTPRYQSAHLASQWAQRSSAGRQEISGAPSSIRCAADSAAVCSQPRNADAHARPAASGRSPRRARSRRIGGAISAGGSALVRSNNARHRASSSSGLPPTIQVLHMASSANALRRSRSGSLQAVPVLSMAPSIASHASARGGCADHWSGNPCSSASQTIHVARAHSDAGSRPTTANQFSAVQPSAVNARRASRVRWLASTAANAGYRCSAGSASINRPRRLSIASRSESRTESRERAIAASARARRPAT